eukprot:TRINITY_DN2067_c0_g3_i2.p1 TRINITY_DN2067_c0_g3~~TRINITY_DN2067_c0_g3_i2.p1  ORF type:complete len:496 (-),score=100.55 TRINITY_DN2067_c0_g3_i2:37-1377(-)
MNNNFFGTPQFSGPALPSRTIPNIPESSESPFSIDLDYYHSDGQAINTPTSPNFANLVHQNYFPPASPLSNATIPRAQRASVNVPEPIHLRRPTRARTKRTTRINRVNRMKNVDEKESRLKKKSVSSYISPSNEVELCMDTSWKFKEKFTRNIDKYPIFVIVIQPNLADVVTRYMTHNFKYHQFDIDKSLYKKLNDCKVFLRCVHESDINKRGKKSHCWPEVCSISVNGTNLELKKKTPEKKQQNDEPYDLSGLIKLGSNTVKFSNGENSKYYLIGYRVEDIPLEEIMVKVKIKDKESSIASIKKSFEESEIEMNDLTVSLLDPLTFMKIDTPCKSTACTHIRCFDLKTYLESNYKQNSTWKCPICTVDASFKQLRVDRYIESCIKESAPSTTSIVINNDTKWTAVGNDDESSFDDSFDSSEEAFFSYVPPPDAKYDYIISSDSDE